MNIDQNEVGNIVVERGIPLPEKVTGKGRVAGVVYPYEKMEVGDSFLVGSEKKHMINVMCTKNKLKGEELGRVYVARKVEGGVRVWRTK
jgi:hypothetical protein